MLIEWAKNERARLLQVNHEFEAKKAEIMQRYTEEDIQKALKTYQS